MPLMHGVSLSRILKKIDPEVRLIAMSGHTEESQQSELSALGVTVFLKKPFNNYQLLKAVHNVICPAAV